MAEKVQRDPSKYFALWVKHGKDWGSVELEETNMTKQTSSSSQEHQFLRRDQMLNDMPAVVADALIAAAKGNPDYEKRHVLAPENDALARYKITTEDIEKVATLAQNETQRRLRATLDTAVPMEVCQLLQQKCWVYAS